MSWWRGYLVACLLCLCSHTLAAPQINWGDFLKSSDSDMRNTSLSIDLRSRWEATLVGDVQLANSEVYAPDQVWNWPSVRFTSKNLQGAIRLRKGERMVARMTVFSEQVGTDFTISLEQPRLDAAHVSYRYDGGPWTTLSSGDTIAMNRWAQPDRHPSFNLPLLAGQMDVVVQIAHRGVLEMPVELQNTRAFLEERTYSTGLAGMMVGISFVMALMGLMMALNYRRVSFLSVTLASMTMATVLMFTSGLGGMFVVTNSMRFNDEIKFFAHTTLLTTLPLVAALALGHSQQLRFWWWSAWTAAVLGAVLTLVWMSYDLRDSTSWGVPVLLLTMVIMSLLMTAWAWYFDINRNVWIAGGLALLLAVPLLPFAANVGWMSSEDAQQCASALSLLASILLLRGLFLQYRMGRQVIARADTSPHRDVLTGLLNREGMQAHFYKVRERLQTQETCAIFIYISVLDTKAAMDEHGEQGFEMGMVQMAASLSTSVTGADGVARISGHAFGITVLMPPEPAMAVRMAQKILSRLMVLASHGAAMASTARITLAWMPLNGFRVDTMERRCIEALAMLEAGKRIGWVGGIDSHKDASQLLRDSSLSSSTPGTPNAFGKPPQTQDSSHDGVASNLYDRIHRIEREMLHGVDTQFLVEDADRLSQAKNSVLPAQSDKALSGDTPPSYLPTQQSSRAA